MSGPAHTCYICHATGPVILWVRFWLCLRHWRSVRDRYEAIQSQQGSKP